MAQKIRLTKKLRRVVQRAMDLRTRRTHPAGAFDSGGRWYPDKSFACCESIRTPSRLWPYSLLAYARSLSHLVHSTGYDLSTLKAAVRRIEKEKKNESIGQ